MTHRVASLAVAVLLVLSGCSGVADLAATDTPAGDGDSWQVEVVEVVDGDTLKVEFPDGTVENVRLLGVDTPEVHVANTPDEFEGIPETEAGERWLRDWGHKASEFARTELAGKTIRLETDPKADRRGSYGRLLVYVYADGENFNRQLLAQGYARMYDSTFSQRDDFLATEEQAREDRVGLWDYGEPSSQGPLAVVDVNADAEGADGENLNDEYVVLENTGDADLDLSGWTLTDAVGKTYTFPDGFTLAPGERVTVHSGSGTDTDTDLYWGAGSPVWNNGGDTVIVEKADGSLVVSYEY
jgi:micrococcal nuclease